ncbi:glycosyltransferase family 4 protein [Rhodococcus sp. 06-1460-1B]|uniref:glycosyltransferase family 4 protein n=1 Tax=Rhodococcus sp. 06-1460-1B TaxID=2022501 RepID=UPI001595BF10|nr:glycosyltransferase family 4 protein [Rhodococcus sp. 06-1460-1B]
MDVSKPNLLLIVPDSRKNGVTEQAHLLARWALRARVVESAKVVAIGKDPLEGNGICARGVEHVMPNIAAVREYLQTTAPDIVIIESLFTLTAGTQSLWRQALNELQIPWTLRIHEEVPMSGSRTLWTKPIEPPHRLFPRNSEDVNIIVPTFHAAQFYQNFLDTHPRVSQIAIAIDSSRYPDPQPPQTYDILQVGKVYQRKGPQLTVLAFSDVHRRYPDSRLKFIGPVDRHQEKSLREKISELQLMESVEILGESDDVSKYYSSASLTTLHSSSESTPTVALESIVSGRLFVGSDVGGVREMLQGTYCSRFIFKFGDWVSQAVHMKKALGDISDSYGKILSDGEIIRDRHDIEKIGPAILRACDPNMRPRKTDHVYSGTHRSTPSTNRKNTAGI